MNQDQKTGSTGEGDLLGLPADEHAVLHITSRLIAAVVRSTFGDNAGFVLAVTVPHDIDPALNHYLATTTLSMAHAARLMRVLSEAASRCEPLDLAPTVTMQVCAASYRSFDTENPA